MADYIERQSAVNRFEQLKEQADTMRDKLYLDGVLSVIDALPAANVREDVQGEWEWFDEEHGTPIDGWDREWGWRCSCCKYTLNDEYDDPDSSPKFNFCPHCGADMRGKSNE